MRVGLIGWYGHQNAGDERILHCLRLWLEGCDITVFNSYERALALIDDLNRCDLVLLGGGGLIHRNQNRYAPLIERLKPPFGCVGLGVEAVESSNRRFLNAILNKSEFVLVRDSDSLRRLRFHYKAILGPDLTFYDPYPVQNSNNRHSIGVNLRWWRFWPFSHNSLPDRIMHRLNRRIPHLESLWFGTRWRPADAMEKLKSRYTSLQPIVLYTEPRRLNDLRAMTPWFDHVPEQFSPALISQCRLVVAMRLHALIFACQMGVPSVSMTYQPKNLAFYRELGVENASVDIFQLSTLPHALDYVEQHADRIRERLLGYRAESYNEIHRILKSIHNYPLAATTTSRSISGTT